MKKYCAKIFQLLLDLLFPLRCLHCRREGSWLCARCLEKIPLSPSYERFQRLLVFSAGDYQKPSVQRVIKICKFSAIPELATIQGKLIIRAIKSFPEIKDFLENGSNFLIIPIPLSARRERERGFNQAAIIAQTLSRHFNFPLADRLKKEHRPPQAELAGKKREKNIQGAFSWQGENLTGLSILLIDDVVTTGSTLAEAAKVLRQAGAKKVIGLALAR